MENSKVFEHLIETTENYIVSNGLDSMVLGVSGGIDSTVCAAICHEVAVRSNGHIKFIGRSLPIKNQVMYIDEFDTSQLVGNVFCDDFRVVNLSYIYETMLKEIVEYEEGKKDPVTISKNAINYAKEHGYDYVLIDTAGRLHIDEELMLELENIKKEVNPEEVLLVIDSMMGQDAINVITGFNENLKLTGVILTKLDGDTRGGVALSVRHLTNVPIKFIGVSEKLDGLDYFYPDRMASRIIGMGDILSIVDKANEVIDEKEAEKSFKKMKSGKFDLEDFLAQMKQIKKLGSLESILKLLPGAKKMGLNNINIDPKDLAHIEAIILSMTLKERRNPEILKASHKKRIANGSGRSVQEVNRLLNQFEQSKKMMKSLTNGNFKLPF